MHHHSSDTARARLPADIAWSADAIRKDYLSRVCKHLQTEDITHGEGTALTYAELSGRSGAKLVSFREQSVLFTSPSTPAKIHYVRRTIDKEAKYSDVGELAKELLRQTAGRTKDKQILLYGTPGSGKSRTCAHLTWTLADRATRNPGLPIPVLIDFRVFGSPELLSIAPSLATLSTAEQGHVSRAPSRFCNIAALRRLLIAAFTEEDLRRLCADNPALHGVTPKFAVKNSLEDIVDTLVTYCLKRTLLGELLSAVEKANPRQYEHHEGALFQSAEPSGPSEGNVERQLAEDFLFEVARRAIEDQLGREMARRMEPLLSRYTHDGDLIFIVDSTNEVSPQIFDGLWWAIIKFARTTAVKCGFVVAIREYAIRPGWPGRFIAICAMSDDQVRGFAELYLDPTHTTPERIEQFMSWLKPPGCELPVIARTPFYLWMLTKWFRSRHGRQGWEARVPQMPVLMGAYVESQLRDKAGCPPNEIHNVEGTLQGLAFQATLRDAVGTRIQEDELKQGTYSRGLPVDYEQRLAFAEKARLIHRLDGYLRFDHHRLQEYFAARAWLSVFRFRPGAQIEETIKDVQWEDTIRLAVTLADNPEEILRVIYGPAHWKSLHAPDLEVSWPIRDAIPEHQLQFDTSGKLVELFRRETKRFYLALRCLSGLDDLGNPTLHGKSKSVANEWIVWAETVLANGPASEGITTAEILGEIPWPAAAQALTATLPEVFEPHPFSQAVPHYPWGFAVQAQALKSLLRHRDAGIKEASEILDRISKKAPDLFVQAALQDTPILRKILKYWQMLRPSSRRVLDPLALAASEALRGKAGYSTKEMLGLGLLILGCYLAYALGQAVLSLIAASPLPSFFHRLGLAISGGFGRLWDPIDQGFESLGTAISQNLYDVVTAVAILFLILVVYRLIRGLVMFFVNSRRDLQSRRSTEDMGHVVPFRTFPRLSWETLLSQVSRFRGAILGTLSRLRDSPLATIIRYTWRAMVAAVVAAPFAIPFVGWAFNIVSLVISSSGESAIADSYEEVACF